MFILRIMVDIAFEGDKAAYIQALTAAYPPRFMEADDYISLSEFDHRVFAETGDATGPWRWRSRYDYYPESVELLVVEDEIIACTAAEVHPSDLKPGGCYGHIVTVGVAPEQQGRGIGEYMFGRLVERLKAENPTGILLETRVSNKAMQALASKYGFKIEERMENYYYGISKIEDGFAMIWRAPDED